MQSSLATHKYDEQRVVYSLYYMRRIKLYPYRNYESDVILCASLDMIFGVRFEDL